MSKFAVGCMLYLSSVLCLSFYDLQEEPRAQRAMLAVGCGSLSMVAITAVVIARC